MEGLEEFFNEAIDEKIDENVSDRFWDTNKKIAELREEVAELKAQLKQLLDKETGVEQKNKVIHIHHPTKLVKENDSFFTGTFEKSREQLLDFMKTSSHDGQSFYNFLKQSRSGNCARKNMSSGGGKKPLSATFGIVKMQRMGTSTSKLRDPNPHGKGYLSTARSNYPAVELKIQEFLQKWYPSFPYDCNMDSCSVNMNFECSPHRDADNSSKSLIFSVGNYTGGELCIQKSGYACEPEKENTYDKYDISKEVIEFDGVKFEHWVKPFQGERISFVIYKHK